MTAAAPPVSTVPDAAAGVAAAVPVAARTAVALLSAGGTTSGGGCDNAAGVWDSIASAGIGGGILPAAAVSLRSGLASIV